MTYYDRFNPAKRHEKHLFSAERVLQSAELNEMQTGLIDRIANIGNVLFKDGDLIRDAGCVVDGVTGDARLASGALWLAGAVRGIGPAALKVPVEGEIAVGVYLQEATVTELDDPELLNPAQGTRGYMEPGAARLQLNPVWGVAGDGKAGKFYPVYQVLNGVLKAKEPPPTIDAVSVALQRYDRDSTGGNYIISGMDVRRGAELEGDKQSYIISAGAARANGKQVELRAALRYVYSAAPDLKTISDEPHVSSGTAAQRVNVDYGPIAQLESVSMTAERSVTLSHGVIAGGLDPLPDTSVLQIVEVRQGATVYVKNTDYKLTGGKVDWSPAGAEPAAGSTYTVKYQHIVTVTPTAVDSAGFTVTGAVGGTLILASYRYKMPRVDRLCLNEAGDVVPIKGVASDWMPPPPSVPEGLLLLATVYQHWNADTSISLDSPRMVPMSDLAHVQDQLDGLKMLIAQQQLQSDAMNREAVQKKGVFVDPFMDDSMRDAGQAQSGAIVSGTLTLPVSLSASRYGNDVAGPTTLAHNVISLVEQNRRTGSMAVNPYQAFAPLPASVVLDPAIDQMTYSTESWTSNLTNRIVVRVPYGDSAGPSSTTSVETLSSARKQDQVIRPVTVKFSITGFGPNETVVGASFDSVAVTPGSQSNPAARPVADAKGVVSGLFNIPPNVPVGRKLVQVIGSGGSRGSAFYTAASWAEDRVLRRVVTEYAYEYEPAPVPAVPVTVPETEVDGPPVIFEPEIEPPRSSDPVRAQVESMYTTFLGRKGEPAGVEFWMGAIKQGVTGAALLKEFLTGAVANAEKNMQPSAKDAWEVIKKGEAHYANVGVDPLAQTFLSPTPAHLVGVDLWFEAVGSTDVVVQLRTVQTGLPALRVLAEARLSPSQIRTDGTATRALFALPYYTEANEELAFVVMCNDAETSLSIAELGKWDGTAWITAQPYTIGVLLSSSNNSTWTPHQDRDLKFRVLAANYTETVRNIDLGTVTVNGATDLMVMALEQKASAHATIGYTVELPDGSEIAASSNQPLALSAPVTGNITLRAQLRGDSSVSPVLHRGGQLMIGWLGENGDYVSRTIKAGTGSRVRVVIDAKLPSGAAATVQLKGGDVGDTWSAPIPQIRTTALDNGWHELVYEQTGVNEEVVQARLATAGSAAARPFVRNLRIMVM